MKNLLFIGGTSFFGKAAVTKLLATQKFNISVLTRGHSIPAEFVNKITFLKCDRNDTQQLVAILNKNQFDVIIDNIAFTGNDVKNLLGNLNTSPEHYLLCSSAAVYPEWHTTHQWQETEAVLDYVPGQDSYANGKRAAEKQLLQFKNIPFSIYRPTVVQGPDDNTDRTAFFTEKLCQQKQFNIPDDVILQHVYSADVAQAILDLIMLGPTNKAYNVVGDDQISLLEYCLATAKLLGKAPCFEVLPHDKYFKKRPRDFPALFDHTLILSNELLKKEAKFKPTPLAEWLPITVNWNKKKYCEK